MADQKPRILQGNRDIVMSLLVLMVICAAFAGLAGQCSLNDPDSRQGEIPRVDAATVLRQDARSQPFAVRLPAVPDDWTANSARLDSVGKVTSSHVGWVTPKRAFLELVQSSAPVDDFRGLPGGVRPKRSAAAVNGREWTVFSGDDARTVWATDLGDARVGIVGAAPPADFETLAAAVQDAPPLPKG